MDALPIKVVPGCPARVIQPQKIPLTRWQIMVDPVDGDTYPPLPSSVVV